MPQITMIQPGAPVAPIAISADRLTVGDITIDYAVEQQDEAVEIAIRHSAGAFTRDGADGAFVAIVRIPPRQYTEQPGETDPMTGAPRIERVALPLDPSAVSVELWPFAG
ncbi:hypothetical protein [Hydrogenophilus thermoluteolus]|uniref:Uncharacterized protein n=1 Tax=Hydrogenophilus thermoluteolus TaxID=297 RepID=A0A2Z6DXN6_HYDTE|nr:hypothetical protein [Hydrogenophilus thermoluteolus]BBD77254.1 hypothetical protein HPTL_0987 [Hydrogenophilus thermoluteolus]